MMAIAMRRRVADIQISITPEMEKIFAVDLGDQGVQLCLNRRQLIAVIKLKNAAAAHLLGFSGSNVVRLSFG